MPQQQTFTDVQPIAQTFSNVMPIDAASIEEEKPGYFKRLGQSLGIPTSQDELKAAMPSNTDLLLGPGPGAALKMAIGYGKTAYKGIKEGAQEVSDAARNVLEGGPVGANAGKAAGGVLHASLQATPIIGPSIDTAGQDIAKKNYAGAAGGLTGVIGQIAAPEAIDTAKGLPEASRGVLRKVGNPYGIASTGEELLTQGISPYAKATGFKNALAKAGSDIKAFDADNPIKGVQDLNDAIPLIQKKIMNEEVNPAAKRHADEVLPQESLDRVKQAVKDSLNPFAEEFEPGTKDDVDALAEKMGKARTIQQLIGTSADERGGLLGYINGKLDSYFSKYPSARSSNLMKNPDTAMWESARRSLRSETMDYLADQGEEGVADARLRWGALQEIGKQVERRVNVADRAKPMSINRILGLAGAIPTGGLSVVAGELGHYLNKPDVLIRRGISKLPEAAAPSATTDLSSMLKTEAPAAEKAIVPEQSTSMPLNREDRIAELKKKMKSGNAYEASQAKKIYNILYKGE